MSETLFVVLEALQDPYHQLPVAVCASRLIAEQEVLRLSQERAAKANVEREAAFQKGEPVGRLSVASNFASYYSIHQVHTAS